MSVLDQFRLDDRTAVVTGGNRGIGRAVATALAEAGANVAVANRDEETGRVAAEEIAERTGVETIHVPVDVREEAQVEAMVEETVSKLGDVDVLINNAGICTNTPAEEMPVEEWRRVLDINLTGAFLCAQHVGRNMIESGGGSIVNVSSISAFVANHPQSQVHYQASKAGLEGFKVQLASEWARHGIRVNNINPGYVRTEMVDQNLRENPEMAEIWRDGVLFDEFATPESIGGLAVYLASDASSYVTGESVVIDGGYTVR